MTTEPTTPGDSDTREDLMTSLTAPTTTPLQESDDAPDRREHPGVRLPTVVLGLLLLAVSATVLATRVTDVDLDADLTLVAVLVGAGVLLLSSALAPHRRR